MSRSTKFDFDVFLPSISKNLQRELCWSLLQKQQLILSILKGIRLPHMAFLQLLDDTYQVIDGKQRLNTIIEFYSNKFSIEANGQQYFFSDFDDDCHHVFMTCPLRYFFVYDNTDKMFDDQFKIDWLEQINFAGTPMDLEHLRSLRGEK